jgi:hypothetical protein
MISIDIPSLYVQGKIYCQLTPPDVFLEGGWLLEGVLLTRREEGPLPLAEMNDSW